MGLGLWGDGLDYYGTALAAGVCYGAGFLLMLYAYQYEEISWCAVVSHTYPALVAVLGWVLLDETLSAWVMAGIAAMVGGAGLVFTDGPVLGRLRFNRGWPALAGANLLVAVATVLLWQAALEVLLHFAGGNFTPCPGSAFPYSAAGLDAQKRCAALATAPLEVFRLGFPLGRRRRKPFLFS